MTSYCDTTEDSPRRKAVLFCPACSHEGRAAEDWFEITDEDGVRVLVCPACGETIDRRTYRTPSPPAEAD